ncbi:ribosome silencing factor [Hydrogenophaga sp. T2]|uniref:ribosome silencing factor n=1 Tax=Hydrogenophaga sp. T2 TaxID=3132823 RepID=UPI003CE9E409
MSEASAKKDIQKLQKAIVDGLEDVKGQDIVVFNTEELSPLFERVIIASGTSNRQTKALAASVRDAVREAGFDKPRVEGEDNGEWIIVDCGQAVAHVMQPVIRQYYRLEEIWGAKPVRLKAAAKAASARPKAEGEAAPAKKAAAKKAPSQKAPAKKAPAKKAAAPAAPAKKAAAKAAPAKKAVAKPGAKPAAKTAAKKAPAKRAALPKVVVNAPAAKKKAAPAARKTAASKPAAKKKA